MATTAICLIINNSSRLASFSFHSSYFFSGAKQANDSGLASYVAGQIDRSLSWKVCQMRLHG